MTTQEHLTLTRRRALVAVFVGMVSFFIIAPNFQGSWIPLIPFAFTSIAVVFLVRGIRCPHCNAVLAGSANGPRARWFGEVSRYCPNCGTDLSEARSGKQKGSEPEDG